MEHLLGIGDQEPKTYGPLRDRHGEQWGRIAEDVEEVVPVAAPVLDWIFGKRESENPTESDWKVRPRPYRGPTADPSKPAAERQEYEERLEAKRREERQGLAQEVAKEAEQNQKKEQAKNKAFVEQSQLNAENDRLAFFGRPAQKLRLQKREQQLERNEREWQCCIFKHLETDIEAEIELQRMRAKNEKSKKNAAARQAANLRAKERGARAAEKGLHVCGEQLKDATAVSSEAAERYAAEAFEQEEKARAAKIQEEDAERLLSLEDEKLRCVQTQVKWLRWDAKAVLEICRDLEIREIQAVVAEEKIVLKFLEDANHRLRQLPEGNPAWHGTRERILELERRLDVLLMEKRMFVPMYTDPNQKKKELKDGGKEVYENESKMGVGSGKGADKPVEKKWLGMEKVFETVEIEKPLGAARRRGPDWRLLETPPEREFEWKPQKQKPGMICLGTGRVGVLTVRQKVVKVKGKNEKYEDLETTDTHEGLEEFGLCYFFKPPKPGQKSEWPKNPDETIEINTHNAAEHIRIVEKYLAKPPYYYLNREDYEAGETEPRDLLNKESFLRLFQTDERHEAHYDMPDLFIKLRYPVKFVWATTWVGEPAKEFLLKKKKKFMPGSKAISHTLGPKKLPFEDVVVPGLHDSDKPGSIDPHFTGTIEMWIVPFGATVEKGQLLAYVTVEDERHRGTSEVYVPDPTKAKHAKKFDHGDAIDEAFIPKKSESDRNKESVRKSASFGKSTSFKTSVSLRSNGAAARDSKALYREADHWHGLTSDSYLLRVEAPAAGKLVGIMRGNRQLEKKKKEREDAKKGGYEYKSDKFHKTQVKSFEPIAWIDCGKEDWERCLLPVDEWPDA